MSDQSATDEPTSSSTNYPELAPPDSFDGNESDDSTLELEHLRSSIKVAGAKSLRYERKTDF